MKNNIYIYIPYIYPLLIIKYINISSMYNKYFLGMNTYNLHSNIIVSKFIVIKFLPELNKKLIFTTRRIFR